MYVHTIISSPLCHSSFQKIARLSMGRQFYQSSWREKKFPEPEYFVCKLKSLKHLSSSNDNQMMHTASLNKPTQPQSQPQQKATTKERKSQASGKGNKPQLGLKRRHNEYLEGCNYPYDNFSIGEESRLDFYPPEVQLKILKYAVEMNMHARQKMIQTLIDHYFKLQHPGITPKMVINEYKGMEVRVRIRITTPITKSLKSIPEVFM